MEKNKKTKPKDLYKQLLGMFATYPGLEILEDDEVNNPKLKSSYGYYDPRLNAIVVDRNLNEKEKDVTAKHELVHAAHAAPFLNKVGSTDYSDPIRHEFEMQKKIFPNTPKIHPHYDEMGEQMIKEALKERSRKLTPYELLIKREQEKVLGPSPE
jgi:hypothetical protein